MDQIFMYLLINRHHVDYMVKKDARKGRKFCDVYYKLFPSVERAAAMESFLKILKTFEFNDRMNGVHPYNYFTKKTL